MVHFTPLISLICLSLPQGWGKVRHETTFFNYHIFTALCLECSLMISICRKHLKLLGNVNYFTNIYFSLPRGEQIQKASHITPLSLLDANCGSIFFKIGRI